MNPNFYELLELSCDPAERDPAKIDAAISRWTRRMQDSINSSIQQGSRMTLAQINALAADMGKLKTDAALRKQHADDLLDRRRAQLRAILQVIRDNSGSTELMRSAVMSMANRVGLSMGTARKLLAEEHFTMIVPAAARKVEGDILLARSDWDRLTDLEKKLRDHYTRYPDGTPMAVKLAAVSDAYAYVGAVTGTAMTAATPCAAIQTELRRVNPDHSGNMPPKLYLKDYDALLLTRVFDTDAHRDAYDRMVRMRRDKLDVLMAQLPQLPPAILRWSTFAMGVITRLQKYIPDQDDAIAVYNAYSGLTPDTYFEKESTEVTVVCGGCARPSTFGTLEQARKAVCPQCGAPLFVECPKCHHMNLASASHCVNSRCGFYLHGRRFYPKHVSDCEQAIRRGDLSAAEIALSSARAADPAGADLKSLDGKVSYLRRDLKKTLDEIETMIAQRQLYAARARVAALAAARPGMDVKPYTGRIDPAIHQAENDFAACPATMPADRQIAVCTSILSRVADFAPALTRMQAHRPAPATGVRTSIDPDAMACTLIWQPAPGPVQYIVRRKEASAPVSQDDGVEIASGLVNCSCRDASVKPGVPYYYAVYAVRTVDGVVSPGAFPAQPVVALQKLTALNLSAGTNQVALTWPIPAGSSGVIIDRVALNTAGRPLASSEVRLASHAKGSFVDSTAKNGHLYRYTCYATWLVNGRERISLPVQQDILVMQRPKALTIRHEGVMADHTCRLSWPAVPEGTLVRIFLLNNGQSLPADSEQDLAVMGRFSRELTGGAIPGGSGAMVRLPANSRCAIAVGVVYGTRVVLSNTLVLSTAAPAVIATEPTQSYVSDNTLHLSFKVIPKDVTRLYYQVKVGDAASDALYVQGIDPTGMTAADPEVCRRQGLIVPKVSGRHVFVSVIAEYGTGATAYTAPAACWHWDNTPKTRIQYQLHWSPVALFSRQRSRQGVRLRVNCPRGTRRPRMALVVSKKQAVMFDGMIPGDPNQVHLLELPSCDNGPESQVFSVNSELLKGIPAGHRAALFVYPEDAARYETSPVDPAMLILP